MKGNRWDDHYARQAKKDKWLARSVFKLEEINRRHKILKKGMKVLDLGCYPGSWSQYCIRSVGDGGLVFGIDLKKPERLSSANFRFIHADVFSLEIEKLTMETGAVDIVISDMAPSTTGIKTTDESRSLALAQRALEIARAALRKKGNFLCKVFEGEELKTFTSELSHNFRTIKLLRPKAIRKRSREVYVLGLQHLNRSGTF